MYSLFLYRKPDELNLFEKSCFQNTSKSDDYRRNCYKYSLELTTYGGYISFPPEYGKTACEVFKLANIWQYLHCIILDLLWLVMTCYFLYKASIDLK